ncbi:FAD-binding and (Fe-S)-binding domain-containing protein [Psychroflexus sp. ALD_RP9]|uniref:FAD-binding and (Fe-S)-binding domain-containing protein n=1 Tax=Psychroflexus sp. ALD_RP9 TaxID=2777186 RepID=UPI001A8FDC89|nr:FAD-binding and (Fe-S)-binding domain-containing protein [Psychroflexus sp. ALD_RP9]QSS97025.1 FAD-binding protein [Psychroflexus sp. ALD_RP9]
MNIFDKNNSLIDSSSFSELKLKGQIFSDRLHKHLYATDASVYREIPQAIAYPKDSSDVIKLIKFAKAKCTNLIFRTAGTSLAGQCVGNGILVDVSKYFTKISNFNEKRKTVTVQPGVIRDDLNAFLRPYNLQFGPNTSTSNRCMIGGMIGNNSSGTTSIKYGVTRDKVESLSCILDDGSRIQLQPLTKNQFQEKLKLNSREGDLYRKMHELLSDKSLQKAVKNDFPKPEIHRRNTGYALDALLESELYSESNQQFNLAKLICGSEGTLAFVESITLNLDALPPEHSVMVVAHFQTITDCLNAVKPVMQLPLFTCEMMDKTILDCTKSSLKYKDYRFFLNGDPQAILMLELRSNTKESLKDLKLKLQRVLKTETNSYFDSVVHAEAIFKVLELRKAGLGLLANISKDTKAVACIEDTAVTLDDFSQYMTDFELIMRKFKQSAVYYAHAGAGELHLRPRLNLKTTQGVADFKAITAEVAHLVKSYKGSFSGEHGDGIVRSNFIELLVGSKCYEALKSVKNIFDSEQIFNPGKIINPKPIDKNLRYEAGRVEPDLDTILDFSPEGGILKAAENCNGSGDCRVSTQANQAMCPSYQATTNEKDTTRARANALREFLTHPKNPKNAFNQTELKQVFDLCISCKACKKECPSNVDVASFKAEFLQHYYQNNSRPLADYLLANLLLFYKYLPPKFYNFIVNNKYSLSILKHISKIHNQRSLPNLSKQSLQKHIKNNFSQLTSAKTPQKTVYFFVDEFTNFLDASIGKDAINLLSKLNYNVKLIQNIESGRALISKGFLKRAKKIASDNVKFLSELISAETPLLGIEPSAILSFRDEYLRLNNHDQASTELAQHTYLIEEFLANEFKLGNISSSQFTSDSVRLKIHTHCHQKALSNSKFTFDVLNIPENYHPTLITSGCCGMAGSFGYEKEHYETSQSIGELFLFPSIRKTPKETIIVANGTSCRHQIKDALQRSAKHPVSVLYEALIDC